MSVNLSDDGTLVAFVPTTRLEQARDFFQGVLGLRLLSDDEFALAFAASGALLRVVKVQEHQPAAYTIAGWIVADIGAAVDALKSADVACKRFEDMPQDERGICTFPGGGRVAWFNDPDGNLLSFTQAP